MFLHDLWGKGGSGCKVTVRLVATHTQPGLMQRSLPRRVICDPANPGPHGDGVLAYYTALEYGTVHFAILEDRKFRGYHQRSSKN